MILRLYILGISLYCHKTNPYNKETVSQRPKMAAPDAVLSSLLTTAGLGTESVNLHGKEPYHHAHSPLAKCFLDYSHSEDGPARFCFHYAKYALPAQNTPKFYFRSRRMTIIFCNCFCKGLYKNPSNSSIDHAHKSVYCTSSKES